MSPKAESNKTNRAKTNTTGRGVSAEGCISAEHKPRQPTCRKTKRGNNHHKRQDKGGCRVCNPYRGQGQDKDKGKTRGVLQQEPRDCGCEGTSRGSKTRLWAVGRDCGRTVGL